MGLKQNLADSWDIERSSVTNSMLFLLGTACVYLLSGVVQYLPDLGGLVFAAVFVVFWLGFPFALHYDKRFVSENSDWRPSRLYYFGLLPSYLGLAVVGIYLYKRREAFRA